MGLFSFLKEAGANIFGGSKKSAEETAAEQVEQIKAHVAQYELDITDLEVLVEGEKITLKGMAGSQADKEKLILAAGNVKGIATVEDMVEVETPEPEATFHTVGKGDSLSKIAKAVYGDAMKYPMIFEANKPMLSDPNKIYPGQVLRIPPLTE